MIVDSSALVALVRREPEAPRVIEAIAQADDIAMSAPVWFETCIVLLSPRVGLDVDQVISIREKLELRLISFDEAHAEASRDVWLRYGKGRHPAGLNYADCMSYATAQLSRSGLLFVGDDFTRTDIARV